MARKSASTIADDDFETAPETPSSARRFEDGPLDGRLFDLDDEAESPFLRAQKRVPVKRGKLPRFLENARGLLLLMLACGVAALIAATLYRYATQSWRFQVDSSDNIDVLGTKNVSRAQVLDVFSSDIERNIFFVPLDERRKQMQEIPWVGSATVMRLLPNRLSVAISERTPVAFAEVDSRIAFIDAHGVIMPIAPGQQSSYSFPVILGMTETEPPSTRAARMKIYMRLVGELDSSGSNYSRDLSDVDLSDPDDVKAMVADPQGAVLVHLGSANFLERFQVYRAHVQEWRTQFQPLKSVDLRYQHQVIVNPDEVSGAPSPVQPETQAGEKPAPTPNKNKAGRGRTKSRN